jgi:hypothetical protein
VPAVDARCKTIFSASCAINNELSWFAALMRLKQKWRKPKGCAISQSLIPE